MKVSKTLDTIIFDNLRIFYMNRKYQYRSYIFLAIVFISIALRLHDLGRVSLWFDEAIAVNWADNLSGVFKNNVCTPPLYFLLLFCWRILGDGEFILRLLSVIFGIGSVVGIYFLGKIFFDTKTAIISSFILALAPFHIYYSQELTMYSLFSFLILLAILCFKKALKYEKWGFWIGFSIFSALSILTHYIAVLILFAEIVFFLLFWREYKALLNKWIKSHLLILLFISPWLPLIVKHTIFGINSSLGFWIFWLPSLSWQTIIITLKNFSIGYNATYPVLFIASAAYFLLFIFGVYSIKKRSDLFLLLFLIFIPILIALLLYQLKVGVYVDRYFLPGAFFYYLIVAKGLSHFKRNILLFTMLILISILNGLALKNYYLNNLPKLKSKHFIGIQKKLDFRSAAYYIAENFQEGDIIIHTSENSIFPLEYYLTSQRLRNSENFSLFSEEGYQRRWARLSNDLNTVELVKCDLDVINPYYTGSSFDFEKFTLGQYDRTWVIFFFKFETADKLSLIHI